MLAKPQGIPIGPGSYQFHDERGNLLYVGKAKNLRSRLASYFAPIGELHPRTATMVEAAHSVTWIVTDSELEALLLEANLVATHHPPFNVRLQQDHAYPYLAVIDKPDAARVMMWRKDAQAGVRRFGPYPQARVARHMHDLACEAFGMRSCSDGIYRQAVREQRPCLLADIGRCSAPCVGRITIGEYDKRVKEFTAFLSGDARLALKRLETEMQEAATSQDYERAARLRDSQAAVRAAVERQHIVAGKASFDAVSVASDDISQAVAILRVRKGAIIDAATFMLDSHEALIDDTPGDDALEPGTASGEIGSSTQASVALERALGELYQGPQAFTIPKQIATNHQVSVAWVQALRATAGKNITVGVVSRGHKRAVVALAERNAIEALARERARGTADPGRRADALGQLGDALGLVGPPWRIECFDISHTQGIEQVASMVVLEDGLAAKRQYRSFNITGLDHADDFAAMRQAVARRFKRARSSDESFSTMPDLLLIDGGIGQLGAAIDGLKDAGVDVPVAALAKRLEEVWLPGRHEGVQLGDAGPRYILQRARDEAHRFAITHHRKRRGKRALTSALDGIRGLGPQRAKALMAAFKSVKAIRGATVDEIVERTPLPRTVAQAVVTKLGASGTHTLEAAHLVEEDPTAAPGVEPELSERLPTRRMAPRED